MKGTSAEPGKRPERVIDYDNLPPELAEEIKDLLREAAANRKAKDIIGRMLDNLYSASCLDLAELFLDVQPTELEWLGEWAGAKQHP